jgi:hypothetical protein
MAPTQHTGQQVGREARDIRRNNLQVVPEHLGSVGFSTSRPRALCRQHLEHLPLRTSKRPEPCQHLHFSREAWPLGRISEWVFLSIISANRQMPTRFRLEMSARDTRSECTTYRILCSQAIWLCRACMLSSTDDSHLRAHAHTTAKSCRTCVS